MELRLQAIEQMKTLLEHFPHAPFESIGNTLIERWRSCLVSFHVKKPYHDFAVLTMGTGFLFMAGKSFTIATAQHVLRDYGSGQGLCAMVDGELVSLDGLEALQSEEEDCAFVKVPDLMANKAWVALVSGQRSDMVATSSFMIFGFPEVKNRFDIRRKGQGFQILNIVCHGFEHDWKRGVLLFRYDPKTVYFEEGGTFNAAPNLKGMSGAPVAQLLFSKTTGAIGLRPVGIFKEWYQGNDKRLVAHCFPDFGYELDRRWGDIG